MRRILVVEDSPEYQLIIQKTLSAHRLICVSSAEDGLFEVRRNQIDLIILDINLPKKNGYAFLNELQADDNLNQIPVFCVSGNSDTANKVTAFSLGADDYIVKPFDPIELQARVNSRFLRQSRSFSQTQLLRLGDVEIDQGSHQVHVKKNKKMAEVDLTQTEFKILCHLARRPDQIYTRDQLLVAVWGDKADVLDRAVDVHVCSIRKKLGPCSVNIKAAPRVGYKLTVDRSRGHGSEQEAE